MTNGSLPDLSSTGVEVIAENIRAVGPIYSSAMLEELKLFQVADQLVAAFQNGMLPINRSAARNLYQYWRETPQRLTAADRKNLYSRVLGTPGGEEGVVSNRDFNDLWIRFISSVSELNRASDVPDQTRITEETRAAARDLAANLSQRGYGITYFAAVELQKQINQILKMLADPEIQKAYGARDAWQVVDEIANLELGGAANATRYRTLASSGANIIAWIAKNTRKFSISGRGPLISLKRPITHSKNFTGQIFVNSPTDAALASACEQWLAVSGTAADSADDLT